MEFQLPSVLQKKLTPYDEVRRKVESAKKKAVRKASKPFHLGLPPVDLLIPNDVLPRNCDKEDLIKRIKLPRIYNKYIDHKNHKLEFNSNEVEFLEKILEYERDILNEKDILIIAQLMRNILDDFSFEFGYINNEDVYDRVFSNFCIGK